MAEMQDAKQNYAPLLDFATTFFSVLFKSYG